MLTYVVFSKAVCQTCLRRPDLHRVSRLTCLNLNFRHIYSDCSKSVCSILHTVRMPRMTFQVIYFVTELMTQSGSASPGSSACFSIKYVYSEEGGGFGCSIKGVRQTHPLTRPSQLWLGLAWLAHRLSQWCSCESTHTHSNKHGLGTTTRTHQIPQNRGLCITNYASDMETQQSRKHLPFIPPPPYMTTLMPFFEKEKERERGPI